MFVLDDESMQIPNLYLFCIFNTAYVLCMQCLGVASWIQVYAWVYMVRDIYEHFQVMGGVRIPIY